MSKIEQLEKQLSEIQSEIEQLKTDGGANTFSGPITVSHPEYDKGQEFEEGQWVVIMTETHSQKGDVVRVIDTNYSPLYPFDTERFDGVIGDCFSKEQLRPASTSEISEALIAEAKRRGYKDGVTVISKKTNTERILGENFSDGFLYCDMEHEHNKDELFFRGICIYSQGDWAEIIEPTEEPIEINGYGIKVDNQAIRIECGDTIGRDEFVEFYALVEKYDLTIHRKGEDITKQIHQISEKL